MSTAVFDRVVVSFRRLYRERHGVEPSEITTYNFVRYFERMLARNNLTVKVAEDGAIYGSRRVA